MIDIVMLIIGAIIILNIGAVIGFFLCSVLNHQSEYAGVIKIIKEEDRVLYSLELQDNPELLDSKDEVIFKVETSSQSSNRK